MVSLRDKHLSYIEFLKEETGLSVSALAKKAGISDSTLTRFISKDHFDSLSSATLDKISKVAGYDSYEEYLLQRHTALNKNSKQQGEGEQPPITDADKFEMYESVKRLLTHKYGFAEPKMVIKISEEVLANLSKLNTNFISDSLIMYAIEKEELQSKND